MAQRTAARETQHQPRTLRELRTRLGLTQETVAQALGVGRDAISKMEAGLIKVQIRHLPVLAELYGVDIAMLVQLCVRTTTRTPLPQPSWEQRWRAVLRELVRLERERAARRNGGSA